LKGGGSAEGADGGLPPVLRASQNPQKHLDMIRKLRYYVNILKEGEIMERLLKQWQTDPLRVVLKAALIALALLWCLLGALMRKTWADWLFLPILCLAGTEIIIEIKARKLKKVLIKIGSFIALVLVVSQRLLFTFSPDNIEMRTWTLAVCFAVAIILTVAGNVRSDD
jgi:hypothetical protein